MNILVTGATGFVGQALVKKLGADGHAVKAVVRGHTERLPPSVEQLIFKDLVDLSSFGCQDRGNNRAAETNESFGQLELALKETEVLIHTAARVHVMKERAENPLNLFKHFNTEATLALALKAASAGVKRFIFLSTIKVNGELTTGRVPFSEKDVCQPVDPYAISKMEAEKGLMEIAEKTGMELVIIRPPLIYGPGVKGNFARMIRWIDKGIPLPLGAINNQRSLLALDNLVDFICHCLEQPEAANQVFLISDEQDVSTTELLTKLAYAQGKKIKLFPAPVKLMASISVLLGKKEISDRLFGSLQIDSQKARNYLNWSPVVSMEEQLREMFHPNSPEDSLDKE